jgi:hypothetical protein
MEQSEREFIGLPLRNETRLKPRLVYSKLIPWRRQRPRCLIYRYTPAPRRFWKVIFTCRSKYRRKKGNYRLAVLKMALVSLIPIFRTPVSFLAPYKWKRNCLGLRFVISAVERGLSAKGVNRAASVSSNGRARVVRWTALTASGGRGG